MSNGDSGPSCFVSVSSHRHGLRTSCSASFHPWQSCHVTTGSCDSTLCYTPASLEGTRRHCRCPNLCRTHTQGEQLVVILECVCYTTNMVDWVVQHPNHRAIPSLATTSLDLLVPAPRHGSPPAVPRPKVPVYRHGGCWPFVYIMPQDVAVYHHAGRTSLMSWGTFRAAQAVLGQDVLIAAALAFLACESRKLICDVSYHG
jgi:hypothetical protein